MLEHLRGELNIDWPSLESCLAKGKKSKTSEQERSGLVGILKNFPLLQAVVLESNRHVMKNSIVWGGEQPNEYSKVYDVDWNVILCGTEIYRVRHAAWSATRAAL